MTAEEKKEEMKKQLVLAANEYAGKPGNEEALINLTDLMAKALGNGFNLSEIEKLIGSKDK